MTWYVPLKFTPQAVKVLEKGCDILENLGVEFWLSAGTILGIYRDGGFIPHDSDLDVAGRDITDRFPEIERDFGKAGFSPLRFTPYQRAFKYLGVIFDIYSFTTEGDRIVCYTVEGPKQSKPLSLFTDLAPIEFKGRSYPMPNPVEKYLEVRYGDTWNVPATEKKPWTEESICVE